MAFIFLKGWRKNAIKSWPTKLKMLTIGLLQSLPNPDVKQYVLKHLWVKAVLCGRSQTRILKLSSLWKMHMYEVVPVSIPGIMAPG